MDIINSELHVFYVSDVNHCHCKCLIELDTKLFQSIDKGIFSGRKRNFFPLYQGDLLEA